MLAKQIKDSLLLKLKKAHCFWSYDPKSISEISDGLLIEKVLLHLDLKDIEKLFLIYSPKEIKQNWIKRLIPQGEYIYSLNKFIASYYFHIKRPGAYVKAMATRQLNQAAK